MIRAGFEVKEGIVVARPGQNFWDVINIVDPEEIKSIEERFKRNDFISRYEKLRNERKLQILKETRDGGAPPPDTSQTSEIKSDSLITLGGQSFKRPRVANFTRVEKDADRQNVFILVHVSKKAEDNIEVRFSIDELTN